jgi:hypothetical protein
MQSALQPYATAGVAVVAASLIAVTPVAAPLPDLPNIQSAAVQLTASWDEVFDTASANLTTLVNNFLLAPGVGLQQFLVNQSDFLNELLSDPSKISDVLEQMQAHLDAVLTGFTLQNATFQLPVTAHTLSPSFPIDFPTVVGHAHLFEEFPELPHDQYVEIAPILNFLSSPLSGIIIGDLGPFISPFVALGNDITSGNLADLPADMVGGFLNGATLDLSSLLPAIEQSGGLPIPPGSLTHLDIAFGGLLTPGDVLPIYQVANSDGTVVAEVPAVGGSIFNSVGLTIDLGGLDYLPQPETIVGHAIGPIGAAEAWSQIVGVLLGSGWGDGQGPVVVKPPLFGLPLIAPTDMDDGGGGETAATDLPSWVSTIAADLGLSI